MESFIQQSKTLLDTSVCNDLIDQFEAHTWLQVPGKVGVQQQVSSDGLIQETEYKKSTDLGVTDQVADSPAFRPSILKLFEFLNEQVDDYKKSYTILDEVAPWGIREKFNIQRYKPNEGYYAWHSEYHPHIDLVDKRCLAWMVYLNDVDSAGTEFKNYGKFDAVQGSCLIWPAYWTHTHRGNISQSQTKYIVTGWYSFLEV